ncbi:hypothetical protein CDD80_3942 [Ophiocordyceps camponoti-rufipedis]|uniref:Uncharacterized protein n=1 Tax=Ophiocordyceps camponoti-rufipedis TaxID=2004952 RepID=A0A2C5Z0S7_9HYPO|nr:hypothetical protein CDD80_3942 [Ophiocordyceps camponoti-rufipedis]
MSSTNLPAASPRLWDKKHAPGSQLPDFDGSQAATLLVQSHEAEHLARFTLAIFKDVFSKEYSAGANDMPYLLAPVDGESIDWAAAKAAGGDDLDW